MFAALHLDVVSWRVRLLRGQLLILARNIGAAGDVFREKVEARSLMDTRSVFLESLLGRKTSWF